MRARLLALLLVAALSAVGAAAAGKPRHPVVAARIPAIRAPMTVMPNRCPIPAAFRPAFIHAAQETGLPLAMLVAVAETESNFQPDAVSGADARGLLQVLPATAASLNLDVDDPTSNVLAGARYLKLMLERYDSADLALAAYNAGPTAVDNAGGAPPTVTLNYVADVTSRWRALVACNRA
jgi:peptidoglycan DL-endopeptidase CwlO